MPQLGNGGVWADYLARMERDQAARCKEPGVNLNGPAADSRKPVQPEPAAPSVLPVAPNLGASEEDGAQGHRNGCAGCDHDEGEIPRCWSDEDVCAWYTMQGARLDASDFAEALGAVVVKPLPMVFRPGPGIARLRRRPR